jgi:hypothetical protein
VPRLIALTPDRSKTPAKGCRKWKEGLTNQGLLQKKLGVGGLDLFAMLNEVGLAVLQQTAGKQSPWITASPVSPIGQSKRICLNLSEACGRPMAQ